MGNERWLKQKDLWICIKESRERIEENIVDFTTQENFADRFAKRLGAAMASKVYGQDIKLK